MDSSDSESPVGSPYTNQFYEMATHLEPDEVSPDIELVVEKIHSNEHLLSNGVSAPYELPQLPIEKFANRLALHERFYSRTVHNRVDRLPSPQDVESLGSNGEMGFAHIKSEYDIHFKRVTVSGEDCAGVPAEDLKEASLMLVKALQLRQKYMNASLQSFPLITARLLRQASGVSNDASHLDLPSYVSSSPVDRLHESPPSIANPWHADFPSDINGYLQMVDGVIHVYESEDDMLAGRRKEYSSGLPSLPAFVTDMKLMCAMIADGPLKSFCYRRLRYLTYKYELHVLLNELKEFAEQKAVPHRDFYNTYKVDTHVHAASSMNQKHLLRYIKKAMKLYPKEVVCIDKGNPMTLEEVFRKLGITAYDLSVDTLDVHADRNTFHRFDKFNAKYNPVGESRLREIFLKTDNHVQGKYFANIMKEVMFDLEDGHYQNAELRISIYGRNRGEWDQLARWAQNFNVYSDHVRWLVQIPRLYDVYKSNKLVNNFQEILENIFLPLFEVTMKPSSHQELYLFLQHVTGLDSVDDESFVSLPTL